MYKVAINICFGGFSLSKKALSLLEDKKRKQIEEHYYPEKLHRHDKDLIEIIELLGEEANGRCAKIEIQEIYSKIYKIKEYDGKESIIELDDENIFIIE